MNEVIKTEQLNKKYGNITALSNVSIKAEPGKIIGLIGPDGAGKSTLMKIILTLEKPDSGNIEVLGKKLPEGKMYIRNHVGYMPEIFSLYTDLSVEENLKFYFRIHKMKNSLFEEKKERLYKFNRLQNFANILAGQLSGGMKQKLALSCALMHDPFLLVLDEPTTGVDPLSRREFWKMLGELKAQGITILVSTPYMDEAKQCDYIYLVHSGNILNEGKPAELINNFSGVIYEITISDPQKNIDNIKNIFKEQTIFLSGKYIHLSSNLKISRHYFKSNLTPMDSNYSVAKIEPTLEDIFLTLILEDGDIDDKQ